MQQEQERDEAVEHQADKKLTAVKSPRAKKATSRPGSVAARREEDSGADLEVLNASPGEIAPDTTTKQNREDINAIAEKRHQKTAAEREKERAAKEQKDKNRSVALRMTTAKFNKEFEQVIADMKESEEWTEDSRIDF